MIPPRSDLRDPTDVKAATRCNPTCPTLDPSKLPVSGAARADHRTFRGRVRKGGRRQGGAGPARPAWPTSRTPATSPTKRSISRRRMSGPARVVRLTRRRRHRRRPGPGGCAADRRWRRRRRVISISPEFIHHVLPGPTTSRDTGTGSATWPAVSAPARPGRRGRRSVRNRRRCTPTTRSSPGACRRPACRPRRSPARDQGRRPGHRLRVAASGLRRPQVTAQSFVGGESVQDGHGHGTHCIGTPAARRHRPPAPATGLPTRRRSSSERCWATTGPDRTPASSRASTGRSPTAAR